MPGQPPDDAAPPDSDSAGVAAGGDSSAKGPGQVTRRRVIAGSAAGTAALLAARGLQRPTAAQAAAGPPNTRTLYPEDFGAVGDATTDDAPAIQACIDAITRSGGYGTIQFGPKTYVVDSGPRRDRQGHAIVALPADSGSGTIRFQGVSGGTVIRTNVTTASYSSSHGCPSIIGGPTPEQKGSRGEFSDYTIELSSLTVVAPGNPTIGGIDLSRMSRCRIEDVYVIADGSLVDLHPTNRWAFAVRLPDGLNYGRIVVDELDAYGFYAGIVLNTAHTQIRSSVTKWCAVGYALTGAGQFNANDPHGSRFGYVTSEACTVHMAGWSPTAGAMSLPADTPFYLVVDLWDIEDADSGPHSTYAHIADANDQIHGRANYLRVKANAGVVHGPLNVGGGANFVRTDISAG